MVLVGFSVLGECVKTRVLSSEVKEIKGKLMGFFSKNSGNFVQHCEWIDYFMGFGGELEHVAFLLLWLSRYVFPTKCYHGYICPNVFSIAVLLVRGTRIALAPAVLAAIYRDLGLLKAKILKNVTEGNDNGSKLVLWAPFQLVQLWIWERFTVLSPKPISCLRGEPRLARWNKCKKRSIHLARFAFECPVDYFLWKPYDKDSYREEGKLVTINSEISEELVSFARCLRPSELVGLDCMEQYLPHRVGMQFGMDQDIPCDVPRCNTSFEVAWSCYNKPLDGEILFLPPRLSRGEVTARYYDWWRADLYFRGRRRSKRIAKITSRDINADVGQRDNRATIVLPLPSHASADPKFVDTVSSVDEMCIDVTLAIVVLPLPSHVSTDSKFVNTVSRVDEMCIDVTPSIDKSVLDSDKLQNVDKSFKMHIEMGSSADKTPPINCETVPYQNLSIDYSPSINKCTPDCKNLSQNKDKSADDMNKREARCFPSLCYTTTNDEPEKAANFDTIVICDEEAEDGDLGRLLAKCREFESRICTLEEEYLTVVADVAAKQGTFEKRSELTVIGGTTQCRVIKTL